MDKIKISIAGGTGYTGGELLRILQQHPQAEVISVSSRSKVGQPIYTAHADLEGIYDFNFDARPNMAADVLFLCLGHGVSKGFLEALQPLPENLKIIDLSRDFRLQAEEALGSRHFVYGLPELQRERIKQANYVANPGCFATAIQLAFLPLAKNQLLTQELHISAITGSSGAGAKLSETTHFSWRNDNISAYKAMRHQHLDEIKQSLKQLQPSFEAPIYFIPMRGDFTRGIFTNCYTSTGLSQEEAELLYKKYYENHPFVQVSTEAISMKQSVNTNRCFIHAQVIDGQLLIHTAIDNLVKGASGQAVQNMNLIFGIPEDTGLHLKPQLL